MFTRLLILLLCVSSNVFAYTDTAREENVVLHTATGDIHGTIMLPGVKKKIPVVLIIAGSGPTDRDGNNPYAMNGALKKIADSLATHNIASLRFDKRGIKASASAGKQEVDLRFDDYVNDAKGWINLLKKDKRFSKVVVIGHSEGSLIGMLSAEKADMFVSIAGAGRPADLILKEQLKEQIPVVRDVAYSIIDSLKKGLTTEKVLPVFYSLFRPSVQPYMISWFVYDPRQQIANLKIPVLIIQGTNDIQIPVDDAKLLAAGKPSTRLVLIDNMNHVLQIVTGGRSENIETYNQLNSPLSGQLIKSLIYFINP